MKVLCIRTYISKETKEVLYTNKKMYKSDIPNKWEENIIYAWVLNDKNEWAFFSKKQFSEYFEEINKRRNKVIDGLLDGQ